MRLRPTWLVVAILVVVGGATVLAPALTPLRFAYRGQVAHVSIETAATLVSLLAAFILLGRYRQSKDRNELLLFVGLLLLFGSNLARSIAPSYTGENPAVVWMPLTATVTAASVLAVAALAPGGKVGGRTALGVAGTALLAAAIGMATMGLLAGRLSIGIDPGISRADAEDARVVGSPGLLSMQFVSMLLFAVAAFGFARRAEGRRDEFLAWLAAAMALGALTRLHYFIYPSIYSEWVFVGDVMRFATYLVLLLGALRQIAAYQQEAARAAVLEERGRIARDLHDGLAQDLAFISLQGERLARRDPEAGDLARAARHALAASRGAIENLRLVDAPLGSALAQVASAIAGRHRTALELEIDDGVDVAPEVRDDLVRIAGEAIGNAIRHGRSGEVRVELGSCARGGVRLAITDAGEGFDPESQLEPGAAGYGLEGMRERAQRLGASLKIDSKPGEGTTVEVVVP